MPMPCLAAVDRWEQMAQKFWAPALLSNGAGGARAESQGTAAAGTPDRQAASK